MKKLLLILCLVAATFGSLMADPVNQQKAEKLGAKFMSTTSIAQKNTDIQLQLVSTAADRDAVVSILKWARTAALRCTSKSPTQKTASIGRHAIYPPIHGKIYSVFQMRKSIAIRR